MTIKVEVDDQKAKAISLYLSKKEGSEETLETIVKKAADAVILKTYQKIVPKDVREFLEISSS